MKSTLILRLVLRSFFLLMVYGSLSHAMNPEISELRTNGNSDGIDESEEMHFDYYFWGVSCCKYFIADGLITDNSVARFESRLPIEADYIMLNSRGGSVKAAMALGRAIRKSKVPVINETMNVELVEYSDPDFSVMHTSGRSGDCLSACVLAFIGGVERRLSRFSKTNGDIGFHQLQHNVSEKTALNGRFLQLSNGAIQSQIEEIRRYFEEMGVRPAALELLLKSPTDLYFPEIAKLQSLGILEGGLSQWKTQYLNKQMNLMAVGEKRDFEPFSLGFSCQDGMVAFTMDVYVDNLFDDHMGRDASGGRNIIEVWGSRPFYLNFGEKRIYWEPGDYTILAPGETDVVRISALLEKQVFSGAEISAAISASTSEAPPGTESFMQADTVALLNFMSETLCPSISKLPERDSKPMPWK